MANGVNAPSAPYPKIVNCARPALDAAGDPAFGVVVETTGRLEVMPVIYASLKPVLGYAERLAHDAVTDERIYIVSRQIVESQRVIYDVADELGHKLHRQVEVIEPSLADEDPLM